MVKQTFINLPEEKRTQIIEAAKREFAEKPLHEASINKIIKELGLARGSFYNYFDNIEDLYFYILADFKSNMIIELDKSIEKNNGDIFKAYEEGFIYIIDSAKDETERNIIKNLFLNFNSAKHSFINFCPYFQQIKEKIRTLYGKVNIGNLKIKDEEGFTILLEMLNDNMFQNVIYYFKSDTSKDKIIKRYLEKQKIIKYGAFKEEK